jgi:hypothetical protein
LPCRFHPFSQGHVSFRLLLRGLKITPRSQWIFPHRMSLACYVQRVHQVTARGETE